LAQELNPDEEMDGGVYKLSGNTGSLRYMAPEVAKGEPYNTSADIYSFAILLWQIYSLEKPFEDYNVKMHRELVIHGNQRPPINPRWPEKLSNLISSAWSTNLSERPTVYKIMHVLRSDVIPSFKNKDLPRNE